MYKDTIVIYKDLGVAPLGVQALIRNLNTLFPRLTIEVVRADQILNQDRLLEKASVFVMPGGRDRFYHQALCGQANAKIKSFIESGGLYLGICGGAYYAASHIEFAKGTSLEIVDERELKFFPGKAIGPLFQKEKFSFHGSYGVGDEGACPIEIENHEGRFPVYYNGGCYFQDAEKYSNVSVLARYIENGQPSHPAIIRCSVGQGTAILSGVHYELESEDFKQHRQFDLLNQSSVNRKKIFQSIFRAVV